MSQVLFVCLGNICRSPAAEGIFLHKVKEAGLSGKITVDSAGTGGWHVGDPPDGRMIEHAKQRGYDLSQLVARRFDPTEDFKKFKYILTMDKDNFHNVTRFDPKGDFKDRVIPLTNFCKIHKVKEVPDPYHRSADGFELVLDILEDACEELLAKLKKEV